MAIVSRARAQVSVELGATIGQYSPLGSFDRGSAHLLSVPNSPGDLSGAALGGELRLWVAPRIGFALSGSTVSSDVGGGSTPNGYDPPAHARVSEGSAQLLFRVTGDGSRARVWLSAGGGLVKHGGDAYEQFGKPTNTAGVFGVGSAIRITGGLNAELGVTTMIYSVNMSAASLAFGPGVFERGRQTDLLLRTGLSYTIY
jgi:hypothetical protein